MNWFFCIVGYNVLTSIQFVSCLKIRKCIDDIKDCLYIQVLHLGTFATFEILLEISENNFFIAQNLKHVSRAIKKMETLDYICEGFCCSQGNQQTTASTCIHFIVLSSTTNHSLDGYVISGRLFLRILQMHIAI